MDIIQPTKEQLNQFVLTNHGSFQQSWQWGELQQRMNRPVRRFLIEGNAGAVAAATFVRHDLGFGKFYWLCPRGPVGRFKISDLRFQVLAAAVFIRIEPELTPALSLQKRGWKKSPKDHNPRATVIVDLTKTEDELLAGMHPKTRYNLRLAQKKELKIKEWIPASAGMTDGFFNLLEKTAKRDKFYLHPKKYYEELGKLSEIKMFGVYYQDDLIAAALVSFWGESATYLHGASDYEHRSLMAPYLLHWEIMKAAKTAGLKHYDFGGVAPKSEPNHFLASVTRFKSGWGGEYVEYAGSWDYVLDKIWYKIYKLVRRIMSS